MGYVYGEVVQVREYGGRMLTRRIVKDLGRAVVICNESEFLLAQRENREPSGVGFPAKDVAKLRASDEPMACNNLDG
jgi:hypothetical protein